MVSFSSDSIKRCTIFHCFEILAQKFPPCDIIRSGQSRILIFLNEFNELRRHWTKPIKLAIYGEITIFTGRLFHHAENIG